MNYYVSPRHRMARRLAQLENNQHSSVHIPVDVIAVDDDYLLTAYVPGVEAKDVKIEVLENTITISGEFSVSENEDSNYLLREVPSGSFSRSLRMPTELDSSKAEAEVVNGILSLRVSKAEVAKAHQIKVKTK